MASRLPPRRGVLASFFFLFGVVFLVCVFLLWMFFLFCFFFFGRGVFLGGFGFFFFRVTSGEPFSGLEEVGAYNYTSFQANDVINLTHLFNYSLFVFLVFSPPLVPGFCAKAAVLEQLG